jgi:RimK-like ATP-grasp domain
MILICGIPSEKPLRAVCERLESLSVPYLMFNQRRFDHCSIRFEVADCLVRGELIIEKDAYELDQITAVYSRMMDDRQLPEMVAEAPNMFRRAQCRGLHETLTRWLDVSPALVLNRSAAMASNSSKPYQSQLIAQQGFLIPPTLITNDPDLVRSFHGIHGRLIYKSISGLRSIVQELTLEDYTRLDRIRWCPTQFQAFVPGTNVRVHTIGNLCFATAVNSAATDYRYSLQQTGEAAQLEAVTLTPELQSRCKELARSIGLEFAGIDLKITSDDEIYCFEVNPCPAYSYYEASTGQPISQAIAEHLAGAQ